jgi:hypothetical protein
MTSGKIEENYERGMFEGSVLARLTAIENSLIALNQRVTTYGERLRWHERILWVGSGTVLGLAATRPDVITWLKGVL